MLDLPVVVKRKSGDQPFDKDKIRDSLMKETGLTELIATDIALEVKRFVFINKLKIVTAPLIREITNTFLLSRKLEVQRLKYTRIGMPYADLTSLLNEPYYIQRDSEIIIGEHVIEEYNAVRKLIGECEKE